MTKEADSCRARFSNSARINSASVGRYPSGPSSVHEYPAAATSSRYCRQGTCLGSFANQTPQESGALPILIFILCSLLESVEDYRLHLCHLLHCVTRPF